MELPPIVSPQEWDAARQELLVKEKELTRARDALAAQRRRMPRMAVEKDYLFDGPGGPASLHDLFDGRRQLIVYRFFFQPDVDGWPDAGCPGCSMLADQVGHWHTSTPATPRWCSSPGASGRDRTAEEADGLGHPLVHPDGLVRRRLRCRRVARHQRVPRDGRRAIFRTYFIDNRGDEAMGSTWAYLDITALGRQEEWEDSPDGYPQTPPYEWWHRHDEYPATTSPRTGE